jgi:ribosomal protein S18 acetylase RimI-like enzyme
VTVRPARPDDESALLALDRATWSPLSPSSEPSPGPFFNERTSVDDVLVAVDDGRIVGWAKMHHPTPLPASEHVWHVTGLAVEGASEGQGVGRALMEALADEARRRGGRRMTLRVFAPNERARRLYERLGFKLEGVLRGEFRVGDAYVDDLFMALDLLDYPRQRTGRP